MLCSIMWGAAGCIAVGCIVPFVLSLLKTPKSYKDTHCIITGGSKGIGFEIAKQLADEGAKVTLIARSKQGLEEAAVAIRAATQGAQVYVHCADCTDHKQVNEAVTKAEDVFGPSECCIANAGLAIPGYFLDQAGTVFKRQMDVNYMGTVHTIKAVAPGMTSRRKGQICIISSGIMAGGFLGYSSYAPTKFAVRALADSLRNEFLGFGVDVCIAYPPDTQSEGYESENKTKPAETLSISPPEVYPAAKVAKCIISGMKKGQYHIYGPDVLQNMIISNTSSTSPRTNTTLEAFIVAPLISVVLQLFRAFHMDRVAAQYGKQGAKKSE